ncbi:MAG: DNA polymerase Y family protein [Rubrivivax sp.]|nr:DNA polymerase Y family protein [Rubrivivax sp.]
MLWFALHLPLLSLEAFCATLPADAAARPVVLLAEHRVHCANRVAAGCGIRPGMQRATALALAAELLPAEANAARDAAALQAVAHAALAFTPAVTLHDTQTVLLEVQASLRLFGGLVALHRRLADALAPLGHHVQIAAAPTALGAALLAQWFPVRPGPGAGASAGPGGAVALVSGPHVTDLAALQALLDAAPLALLGPGRRHGETLQGIGLHRLADLRRLPREGLARRFGTELLDELDRALGHQPDLRRWVLLPARFDSRLELFARADSSEQVLHGASVLLARLVAWAQAQHARLGAFTLRMRHERQRQATVPATELQVALAEPSLDPSHLQLLLRERLARVVLAAPTLELQLQCRHLVAGEAPNGELFPTTASEALGLARLLERLRARLGDDQVQRLVAVADHRPECASRAVPAQGAGAAAGLMAVPRRPTVRAGALPLHRPAWLLPEPLPLAERNTLPLLQGRPLQLLSGPERIETGWWDGATAARDYFIAQAEDASLVWVWRSRLPEAPGEVQWFLQGRFG